MNKWIDERTWTMLLYICYILAFIVISVAGYNYAMSFVGEVSLFMRVVILICICLIVALIGLLIFSVFFMSFFELIRRILKRWRRNKTIDKPNSVNIEESGADVTIGGAADTQDKSTRKTEFLKLVLPEFKSEPIYDVISEVLNNKKEGAFAARVMISVGKDHLKWLSSVPSGAMMAKYFGEEAINSISSYDTGKSAYKCGPDKDISEVIIILQSTMKVHKEKKQAEAYAKQ